MNRLRQYEKFVKIVLCLVIIFTFSPAAFAEDDVEATIADQKASDGLIEVRYPKDIAAPYRQRRSFFGTNFSISQTQVLPTNFAVLNSAGTSISYASLFTKSPVNLNELNLGLRMNTILGTLILDVGGGQGSVRDYRTANPTGTAFQTSWLTLTKKGASATVLLDTILPEPYFVPYASYGQAAFDYSLENNDGKIASGTTETLTRICYGFLIQVNWIDGDSARAAFRDSGLQNTYLDVFYSVYSGATATVANMNGDPQLGLGLRMEF